VSVALAATLLFHLPDSRISESSGLVASPSHAGIFWTHNDSGDTSRLFAVDSHGRTVGVWHLRVAPARDWEAITARRAAKPEVWAGDIGDNDSLRTNGILVHRMVEPARVTGGGSVAATSYRLRYPDGPHDAEAMFFAADGRLRIVTKSLLGGGIYAAPRSLRADRPNLLERVGNAPPLVTDGAELPDGGYVLRDYAQAYVYAPSGDLLTTVDLPDQPQGESLAVINGGRDVLVGSEGKDSAVYEVPLPAAARASGRSPSASPTSVVSAADANLRRRVHQLWLGVGGAVALALVALAGTLARVRRRR